MVRQYFPPSLRDPLKPLTGMHKGIDADLIVSPPTRIMTIIVSCQALVLVLTLTLAK